MIARRQIPNLLTFARVLAVPISLALMLCAPQARGALLAIFIAAAVTDYLDGFLARRWQAISRLGALLDPIADKLLVALMLIYLLEMLRLPPLIFPISPLFIPVSIILLRELTIAGLREFLASRQHNLPVSKGGKWKTALQMLAITLLLTAFAFGPPSAVPNSFVDLAAIFGLCFLYASAVLAVTSALGYAHSAIKTLR